MRRKSSVPARVRAIIAVLAFGALSAVQATPITWVAQGFTFTDGGSLFGGITYNAATKTYSDSLIFTFGGSTFDNIKFPTWNPSYPVVPDFIALVAGLPGTNLTGAVSLFITLESPLNTPGLRTISSPIALEARCADALCSKVDQLTSIPGFGGELIATSTVPEPATVLLVSVALAALVGWGASRRRRAGPE